MSNATLSKHLDDENDDFSLLTNLFSRRTLNPTILNAFFIQLCTELPLRSSRYDEYNSRYRIWKFLSFSYFNTLVDCTLRRLLPNDERLAYWAPTYIASGAFPRRRVRGSRASRESGVRFQTLKSRKRLEITLSLCTQNSTPWTGESNKTSLETLGQRITEIVSQNLILVLERQKWLETIIFRIRRCLARFPPKWPNSKCRNERDIQKYAKVQ